MPEVSVLVLAPAPSPDAGPLARLLDEARATIGERHRLAFLEAGAAEAVFRREPPDDTRFGARLLRLAGELRGPGLVVLGAGSIPLATAADLRGFVEAASGDVPRALANHRYSADVVAIARADLVLADLPPSLDSDNALPRWLAERAGVEVRDLRTRRRLAMDVDSPVDLLLLEGAAGAMPTKARPRADGPKTTGPTTPTPLPMPDDADAAPVRARLAALRALARDPGAELLLAGRMSAADLRWAELHTRSRTRALIEERGLRTATAGALAGRENRRPARSVLGELLDRDGPASLGRHVAALCDGALLDSRVLMAHRLGADERGWPCPEDRFASDLLLSDRVEDPWLRALTAAAADAPVPILLGGHGLVGPGARLALGGGARPPRR
jgi:hypothetical protein